VDCCGDRRQLGGVVDQRMRLPKYLQYNGASVRSVRPFASENGGTLDVYLDPDGRTIETVATGETGSSIISHYMNASESPAWTEEHSSGHWTRYIPAVTGLAAIQTNGGTPVLALANLHGDIVATAALSETETKLLSATNTTEYGVPTTGTPAKYSWLGADQRPTELPTGIVAMGARSYVPQLGRYLQTDPVEGGSADAYAYTHGDPVDETDLTGETTESGPPAWAIAGGERVAEAIVAERVAEEAAARAAAERKAAEDGAAEAAYWTSVMTAEENHPASAKKQAVMRSLTVIRSALSTTKQARAASNTADTGRGRSV
jgi:RHS repeat-associated protein